VYVALDTGFFAVSVHDGESPFWWRVHAGDKTEEFRLDKTMRRAIGLKQML
jgi:hypothetical protein